MGNGLRLASANLAAEVTLPLSGYKLRVLEKAMVPRGGIEPPTP